MSEGVDGLSDLRRSNETVGDVFERKGFEFVEDARYARPRIPMNERGGKLEYHRRRYHDRVSTRSQPIAKPTHLAGLVSFQQVDQIARI